MLTPNNLHGSEHLSGHTSHPAVKQHLASRLTTKFLGIGSTIITALVRDIFICLMSRCLSEARVKDFREAEEKRQVDIRIRGFICHGSKDENE